MFVVFEQVSHILSWFKMLGKVIKVDSARVIRRRAILGATGAQPQLGPVGVIVPDMIDPDPVLSVRVAILKADGNGIIVVIVAVVFDIHVVVTLSHGLDGRFVSRSWGWMRNGMIVTVPAAFWAIVLSYVLAIFVTIAAIVFGNPVAVLPMVSVVAVIVVIVAVLLRRMGRMWDRVRGRMRCMAISTALGAVLFSHMLSMSPAITAVVVGNPFAVLWNMKGKG